MFTFTKMLPNCKKVARRDFEKIRHMSQQFRLELLQLANQTENFKELASKCKVSENSLYLIQHFRQEILYERKYNMEPENRLSLDQIENLVAINKIVEELLWRLKHTTQPYVWLGDEDVLKKALELKDLFGIEEFTPNEAWLKKLQLNFYRPPRNPQHNEPTDLDSILSDLKWELTPRIYNKLMKIKDAGSIKCRNIDELNLPIADSTKTCESLETNNRKLSESALEMTEVVIATCKDVKVKVELN